MSHFLIIQSKIFFRGTTSLQLPVMKIEAKVAKSAKTKSKVRCVGVVKKNKNKYFYSRQILKFFRKRRPVRTNVRKIQSFNESILLKKRGLRLGQPFMINECTVPEIVIPNELEVTAHLGEMISYKDDAQYYRFQKDDLLKVIQSNKDNKEIKLNYSIPQMQLKPEQYEIPSLVSKYFRRLHKVNLWMYFGKRISDWHYDGHDNFLYVLEGIKCVYLTQPKNIRPKNVCSLFNNHCQGKVNQSEIPIIIKALISKGDALFIPKGWWHKVVTLGHPSKAVNYWGNSIRQIIENMSQIQKPLVLKTLLFDLMDFCGQKNYPQWQTYDETQKQILREMMGIQFPRAL